MTTRLTETEERGLLVLWKHGSICPGLDGSAAHELRDVFDALVRKKRADREDTDDGPRYRLRPRGQWEADAIIAEGVS